MNSEERVVFEYLKNIYGDRVVHEPEPNFPPDIVINSSIAVEVRRFNQHFFDQGKPEGLDNVSIPLYRAFIEVLQSLNYLYEGASYYVSIEYKRPLQSPIRKIKNEMRAALINYLKTPESDRRDRISVNPSVTFTITGPSFKGQALFSDGCEEDDDIGGWVISEFVRNMRFCIDEKSNRILKRIQNYGTWWLYLVNKNYMGFDQEDILDTNKDLNSTGRFDKIILLSEDGKRVVFELMKKSPAE